ncbi:MAG: hypothetical protein M3133_03460 [Actinomycetota bacterium]|nr:hypothetical protein [Actinomycetota bacterium]
MSTSIGSKVRRIPSSTASPGTAATYGATEIFDIGIEIAPPAELSRRRIQAVLGSSGGA